MGSEITKSSELAGTGGRTTAVPGRPWGTTLLRGTAAGTFIVYCLWWIFWLAHGQLPPALFLAITGYPAPTTGMTRAILAAGQGLWLQSLACNAFAFPIVGLTALSLAWAAGQLVRGRRMALPVWMFRAWVILLAAAWILKLVTPRQYW